MGLNAYRFSVEWARVEPVEGTFDEEALAHYQSIVDRCLELGMAPIVTFLHFTARHWFATRGGWLGLGSGHQLGLYEVDRDTFARTPKPSAAVYASLVRAHTSLDIPARRA